MPSASPIAVGVRNAPTRLVPDEEFGPALGRMVSAARQTVLCSYFIVDVSPFRGPAMLVNEVLYELEAAYWRGVDARVLIGGSRDNPDILETCMGAGLRLRQLGIPFRLITARNVEQTSHARYTVADDAILVGSHNLSGNSLSIETQDSLLIRSSALASYLCAEFERQWRSARIGPA